MRLVMASAQTVIVGRHEPVQKPPVNQPPVREIPLMAQTRDRGPSLRSQ
ncbi:MAG: hypothetical protein RJB09_829 [Pseudomonadota bacterium]